MDGRSGEQDAVRLGPVPAAAAGTDTTTPTPLRVLCVDDVHDAADTLGVLLRIYGCDVRVCYDGPSALALAGSFHPDVCVLDLTMPGMDGDELAHQVRDLRLVPPPRLVAVTAFGDEAARRRTASAGFDFHLVKPVDPDELANIVADVVIMQGWASQPAK